MLFLCASVASAQDRAVLRIEVRSASGQPVAAAAVGIPESGASTSTDSLGRASITGSEGLNHVRIRALGFEPFDSSLTADSTQSRIVVRLRSVRALPQVDVYAARRKPPRYDSTTKLDGFYERRAIGFGKFFTREDIERSGQTHIAEMFREIAGVRVNRQPGFLEIRFARCSGPRTGSSGLPRPGSGTRASTGGGSTDGATAVAVYVDGTRLSPEYAMEYLDGLPSADIEAVEVYRGMTEVPIPARGNACAAIYLWTRYTGGSVLKDTAKK